MPSIENVNDVSPRRQYTASAAQTAFTYPFPIFEDDNLVVDVDGVTQALNTDYTVSGAGDDTGGTVTFAVAMAGGEIVTIYRDIPIERLTDFATNGPLRSATFNDELDRITLVLQQLEASIGRTLRLSTTAGVDSADLELSPLLNWLDKYVYIGATGVPEPATSVATTTLSQSIIGALLFPQTAAELSAGVTPTFYQYQPGDVRRYGVTGFGDEQAQLQNALNCGEKVVDGRWIACTSNSSLTVPTGVEFKNADITAGASGINLILLNTGCKLHGKFTGTGTTNVTERLIYVAAQAVTDVTLDVEVTNATYGVHAQPTSGTAVADRPKRWKGRVYAHDIVGTVGVSEGYGVLLSPAEDFDLVIHAKQIARHALYLGAGARYNKCTVHVNDCDNYAVQLFSTSGQDATEQNDVTVFAQALDETVAGQGGALAIVQKAHRNRVMVYHDGDGTTSRSVLVEGDTGGPYPLGNEIGGKITGQFTGQDVIRLLNADSTKILPGTDIRAYATVCVIGMRRTGTNGSVHGGYVEGVSIDCQAQAIKGIYDEINTVPSYIGPCDIRNNGAATRVDDQTSGWREGFSREARFSGTTATINAGNVGDTSATLVRAVATTGRSVYMRITDSSVDATGLIRRIGVPADDTHVAFRILNEGASNQTFNYEGVVRGD